MRVAGLVSVSLFLCLSTGVRGFDVSTSNPNVRAKENEGVDLTCTHSDDFGPDVRVEWKFTDLKGSQGYVVFAGKATDSYASRVTMYGSNLRFRTVTRKDNGIYDCEVSGKGMFREAKVKLVVLVPPSPPLCRIPISVTSGKTALLTCHDRDGSPPPTYRWYRNDVLLPDDPNKVSGFKNSTYKLNPANGNLEFPSAKKTDTASYFCEASNDAGPSQRCKAVKMEVRDLNTGGIVAGVIIALLLVALLVFGILYAKKKGYLPKKVESKSKPTAVYQPPSSLYGGEDEDGDFRQKSSFVV